MQGVDVSTMRCGHPDCMDAVYVVENANSSSLTREREREVCKWLQVDVWYVLECNLEKNGILFDFLTAIDTQFLIRANLSFGSSISPFKSAKPTIFALRRSWGLRARLWVWELRSTTKRDVKILVHVKVLCILWTKTTWNQDARKNMGDHLRIETTW